MKLNKGEHVHLTDVEIEIANIWGQARVKNAIEENAKDNNRNNKKTLDNHILGCLGEIAMNKYFDRCPRFWDKSDSTIDMIWYEKTIDVKATGYTNNPRLFVEPEKDTPDKRCDIYMLAIREDEKGSIITLSGFVYDYEVFRDELFDFPNKENIKPHHKKSYIVNSENLRSIKELKDFEKQILKNI